MITGGDYCVLLQWKTAACGSRLQGVPADGDYNAGDCRRQLCDTAGGKCSGDCCVRMQEAVNCCERLLKTTATDDRNRRLQLTTAAGAAENCKGRLQGTTV